MNNHNLCLKEVLFNDCRSFQARTGFEPITSAIPVQRSVNWPNKPTGSWSLRWVQITIQVMNKEVLLFITKMAIR